MGLCGTRCADNFQVQREAAVESELSALGKVAGGEGGGGLRSSCSCLFPLALCPGRKSGVHPPQLPPYAGHTPY